MNHSNGHAPAHRNGASPSNGNLSPANENVSPAEATRESEPFFLWESRGVLCGIEASAVREVLPLPELAPLSGAPEWVGVLDVRGRLVPVVDAGELAGNAPRRFQTSDCVVVLDLDAQGHEGLGLVVEAVRDVKTLRRREIEPLGQGTFAHIARVDGELVRLVNLEALQPLALDGEKSNGQEENKNSSQLHRPRPFCPDASEWERALFEERAHALRAVPKQGAGEDHAPSLVAVRLGGEMFGLDLTWVREFAARPVATPVPGGPRDLIGLVNRRGEVVPLLDVRAALGVSAEGEAGNEVTFIECEGACLGLALDAVVGVLAPDETQLRPPPVASRARGPIRGAVFFGGETLAIVDLPNLLQEGGWIAPP